MKNFMNYDINIKNIVFACLVNAGSGVKIHNNRPSHGIALFLGGRRIIDFGNKKLLVNGNSIVYFPKGSNYVITNIDISDCYAINFQLNDTISYEPFTFKIKDLQNYLPNFKSAKKLWDNQNKSYQIKIKSELYDIMYKLHNEYAKSTSKKSNTSIQPAIEHINRYFLKQNISVSTLAGLCGFSEVYLRRMFTKEFGVSPNKYIKHRKLQYAKELLLSGFYKVNEVCYLSGFNDESYFNREFKAHFGHPPKEYIKTLSQYQ